MEMKLAVTEDLILLEMQGQQKASEISEFVICRLICYWTPTLFDIVNVK